MKKMFNIVSDSLREAGDYQTNWSLYLLRLEESRVAGKR
jgi:hypothetical protein